MATRNKKNWLKEIIKAIIYLVIGFFAGIAYIKKPNFFNAKLQLSPATTQVNTFGQQQPMIITPQPKSKTIVRIDKTMTAITTNQPSALEQRIVQEKNESPFGISFYAPTYILPAYYTFSPDYEVYDGNTPDDEKLDRLEFKAQLSLLVPVVSGNFYQRPLSLNFAYTELSYWQFYAKSQYFRETDYEPQVFASYNFHPNWWLNVGTIHQSNGRGGDLERSWNRAYAALVFSGPNWMVSIRPWILIFKANSSDIHNSNIADYLGHGDLLLVYKTGRNEFSLMVRNEAESGFKRGAEEFDWSVHMWKHFYLYTQFFSGYGQSLIEYNHYTNAAGIGIALNNWL